MGVVLTKITESRFSTTPGRRTSGFQRPTKQACIHFLHPAHGAPVFGERRAAYEGLGRAGPSRILVRVACSAVPPSLLQHSGLLFPMNTSAFWHASSIGPTITYWYLVYVFILFFYHSFEGGRERERSGERVAETYESKRELAQQYARPLGHTTRKAAAAVPVSGWIHS